MCRERIVIIYSCSSYLVCLNFVSDCNCRLYLERDELDNLQKSKIKRSYPIHFAVELQFESHHNNVFCTSDAHDQLD